MPDKNQKGIRPAVHKQAQSDLSNKVLTISEVAQLLRVHASTVYRLAKAGQLPAFKLGDGWRFNSEDVDRWRFARVPKSGTPQEGDEP